MSHYDKMGYMVITYQGAESFRISQGDLSIALNPVSKDSKLKSSKVGADITIISTNHPDFNGKENTSRGDKESFVISGPGEYEVKNIGVKGFLSETAYGGKSINTIYLINFEGMNLAFLGALSNPALSTEAFEALEEIDILFVPIGGDLPAQAGGVLDPAAAYKLAVSLESSIIIPMNYDAKSLKQFLKEGGEEDVKSVDKLVIKKKDLEGRKSDMVVLKEE